MKTPKAPKASQKQEEPVDEILGKDLRKEIASKAKAKSAQGRQESEIIIPQLQAADCREAIHWFAGQAAHYKGSARNLLATDFTDEEDAVLESAMVNMKARGVTPLVLTGEVLYKQAEYIWDFAVKNTTFARPVASKLEIEISGADVLILKDLEAPENFQHLWYLYHYVLYPRAIANKPNLIATPLKYEEFVMYGAGCDDFEYAGNRVSWEKVLWLLDNTGVDLHFFHKLKEEGQPIMLPAEYALFRALKERNLNVMPQHISANNMLDFALIEKGKDHKLDIECDLFEQFDPHVISPEGGKHLIRSIGPENGWEVLRFTYAEILHNPAFCADAAEEVWRHGRKKSQAGRLLSNQNNFALPALPMQDESQILAITHVAGPAATTGGAGTGKTSAILYRLAFLIGQGVNPDRILVISYSHDTLRPLKADLEKLTEKQFAQRVNFYTWHDLGMKILKENLSALKRKPPLKTEPSPQKIIQKLLAKYKKELDPAQLELSEELDELTIASLISIYKANLITPAYVKEKSKSTIDELVAKVYQAYEEQLQKSNRVDRDDMVTSAARLLAEQPDIRKRYQYQFDHILVDEYQDATAAGDLMARLLSFPQDNIFIVGDEDESMDESKGALPKLIADTSLRLPNARCYVLENNWRCHPQIVDHARRLLNNFTRRRINKTWRSGWGTTEGATTTGPYALDDEMQEAEWIAEEVQLLLDTGRKPEEIGILYRYHRFGSIVEEALARKGIRSITSDGDYGVVPDEEADVMAFLRLIMDPDGPKARESFERVCQLRMREVDPKLSIEIAKYAEALNLSYLKAIELYSEAVPDPVCKELAQLASVIRRLNQENMPPAENIGFLARTQRLKDYYSSLKVPPGVRYEPLRALKQLEDEARKFKTVTEFVRHQTKQTSSNDDLQSSVNILTIHEAKGREYNVVFLVGLAEGLFPAETSSDREEERRLFYVGMTRAREHLYLSYPSTFGEVPLRSSSFLIESGFSQPKRGFVEAAYGQFAPQPMPMAQATQPQAIVPLQQQAVMPLPQATSQQVITPPLQQQTPAQPAMKAPPEKQGQQGIQPPPPVQQQMPGQAAKPTSLPSPPPPQQRSPGAEQTAADAGKMPALPGRAQQRIPAPPQMPTQEQTRTQPAMPTPPVPQQRIPGAEQTAADAGGRPPGIAQQPIPQPSQMPAQQQMPGQPATPAPPPPVPQQRIPGAEQTAGDAGKMPALPGRAQQRIPAPPQMPVQQQMPGQPAMPTPPLEPAQQPMAGPPQVPGQGMRAVPQTPAQARPPASPSMPTQQQRAAQPVMPVPPQAPSQQWIPGVAPTAGQQQMPVSHHLPGQTNFPTQGQASAATPNCPGCNALLEPGSKFCADCGRAVHLALPACHLCGAPLPATARFCGECGSNLVGPAPSRPQQTTAQPTTRESQLDKTKLDRQSRPGRLPPGLSVTGHTDGKNQPAPPKSPLPVPPHVSAPGAPMQQRGWVNNLLKFLEGDG